MSNIKSINSISSDSDKNYKKIIMYIFVNKDLDMTKGKICSQVAHVTQLIVEEIIREGYEAYPPSESYIIYMKWKQQCTKIILKASEEELKELLKLKGARYIIDNGQTQVKPNSLTAIGFYPSSEMEGVVKNFKLL